MSTLIQSVEVGKRAKLWQLEQYESVVLVGDEIHSSFGEYKKNSPTMILVGALTSVSPLVLTVFNRWCSLLVQHYIEAKKASTAARERLRELEVHISHVLVNNSS